MHTSLNNIRPVWTLTAALVALLAMPSARAEKPLLEYSFDRGYGSVVADTGKAGLPLTASAAMAWGTNGHGVGGGGSIGRVGDRDISMENKNAAGRGLDGLRALTICGWYKAVFIEPTNGVLLELTSAEGLGYRLHLASRKNPNGSLGYTLVSSIVPSEVGLQTASVLYAPWENQLATEGQWIFFAVVVDLRDDLRMISFYTGTETQAPELLVGSFKRREAWAEIENLGKIVAVRAANSADFKQPVPTGFYFDDLSLYGSAKETGGALTRSEIEMIWERSASKKGTVQ